jgi:alpha-tubulin suppressor-like RCC1 family protein
MLLNALASQATLTVTNIATGCSPYFSLFLKSDGSLWGMGAGGDGQLGNGVNGGPTGPINRPEHIMVSNVTAIALGAGHSLLLKSDGSLWATGGDTYGQLGDGGYLPTNRPEQIVASNVTAIAAGVANSLFVKTDGSLWGMGYNLYGELGDGTFATSSPYGTNRPEQIVAGNVTAIAAGNFHSLFLKSGGSLWGMGANDSGQLGDGTFNGIDQPEQIVASNVTAIAAGGAHSLFLKTDGSLWAMGANDSGQLGDGTFATSSPYGTNQPEQIVASNVTAIAAGGGHSLFLKSDGSLWVMGFNNWGQLGDGTSNNACVPEQIVASHVVAIAAGDIHSLFLKSDGSLWVMGCNQDGQLGDGFYLSTSLPEQIFPPPQPVLSIALSSKTNLQFSATCQFGGNHYLLGSAGMTLPLSQWTPLAANAVSARGTNNFSVTLTNAVNSGSQQFYILQSP